MDNPLVKQDLVAAIFELREDVERQLKANKYYIALHKLDELLAVIRPLDIIEATAEPAPAPTPALEEANLPKRLLAPRRSRLKRLRSKRPMRSWSTMAWCRSRSETRAGHHTRPDPPRAQSSPSRR